MVLAYTPHRASTCLLLKCYPFLYYCRFTRFRAVGMLLISGAKLVTNSNSQWLFAYCLRKQHYYLT